MASPLYTQERVSECVKLHYQRIGVEYMENLTIRILGRLIRDQMFGILGDIAVIHKDYDFEGNPTYYISLCTSSPMPGGLILRAAGTLRYFFQLYAKTQLGEWDPQVPFQLKRKYVVETSFGRIWKVATFHFVFATFESDREVRRKTVFCCIDGKNWERRALSELRAVHGVDPSVDRKFSLHPNFYRS